MLESHKRIALAKSFFNRIISNGRLPGLLVLLCAWEAQSQGSQQFEASVIPVKGTAQYASKGKEWQTLKNRTHLGAGCSVETAKDSTVDLRIPGIGEVTASESTQITLERLNLFPNQIEAREVILNLKSGNILINAKRLDALTKFEVAFKRGTIGVRGAECTVSAEGEVSVITGLVRVTFNQTNAPAIVTDVGAGKTFIPPK